MLLQDYAWPGNIREMEGVLERATIQAGSSRLIVPMHLPTFVRYPEAHPATHVRSRRVPSLKEVERETILQAAKTCHGNVTRMAEMLGIGRTTMWRRLQHMDIPLEEFRNTR